MGKSRIGRGRSVILNAIHTSDWRRFSSAVESLNARREKSTSECYEAKQVHESTMANLEKKCGYICSIAFGAEVSKESREKIDEIARIS